MDILSSKSTLCKECARCGCILDSSTSARYANDWCKACLQQARENTPVGKRFCPQCKAYKILDDFYETSYFSAHSKRIPRSVKCKQCSAENTRRKYSHEEAYADHLLSAYQLTQQEYDAMFARQHGRCAICGDPETAFSKHTGKVKHLAVDHCHTTGKVRGLLCSNCNNMLGRGKDNPETFRRAILYLKKHSLQ